jgi:hypothetical protein
MTDEAMAFVREQGVVLVSAHGPVPKVTEWIAKEPIHGSWWSHPKSRDIYRTLERLSASPDILVCRLVGGKITWVHRRLWPALVRVAHHFPARQIAQVHEEHTAAGRHVTRDVGFPEWVPPEVIAQSRALDEGDALAALGAWATPMRKVRTSTAKSAAKATAKRAARPAARKKSRGKVRAP